MYVLFYTLWKINNCKLKWCNIDWRRKNKNVEYNNNNVNKEDFACFIISNYNYINWNITIIKLKGLGIIFWTILFLDDVWYLLDERKGYIVKDFNKDVVFLWNSL